MTDLAPCSAFVETGPVQQKIGTFTVRTDETFQISSISCHGQTLRDELPSLPGPGRWQNIGDTCFIWTSKNQWLAMTGKDQEFIRVLGREQTGVALTDQTNAWVTLEVEAAQQRVQLDAFLRRLINIDLRAFGPGNATRTAIMHCPAIVLRISSNKVRFLVMRSMADTFISAMRQSLHLLIKRHEIV